jgi:hypothetical protein
MPFTNTVFNTMGLCTTPMLWFLLFPQMKHESKKGVAKLQALRHSELQNVGGSTYVSGFTLHNTIQVIWNSERINETNVTNTFTNKHNKF